MIKIHFPSNKFKIKRREGVDFIFDIVRKKWVVLTPEEWVRQNFIQYLIESINVPLSLLSVEKLFYLNGMQKRYDIVVYKNNQAWMIIECKQMNQDLNDSVLNQILIYHQAIPTNYLIITNGNYTFAFEKKENKFQSLNEVPSY